METPYKLLGADNLKDLLRTLPVDKILEFRVKARQVHGQQLELISDVLREKGHVEEHLEPPKGGYNE